MHRQDIPPRPPQNPFLRVLPSSSGRDRPTTIPTAAATKPPATIPSPTEVAASSSSVVAKRVAALARREMWESAAFEG